MKKNLSLLPLVLGAGLTFAFTAHGSLFFKNFDEGADGDVAISEAGWNNAINNSDTRIYGGGVWSWVGEDAGTFMEVFYTTSDTPGSSFSNIDLALNPDLVFSVDIQSQHRGEFTVGHFAVKLEDQWYASAEALPAPTDDWATHTMEFDPAASAWQLLTIPNEGETSLGTSATFGDAPGSDLIGTIIGTGFVVDRTEGNSTLNFNDFAIVPEPSTYALLAGSLVLAVCIFRNRRRKA